MNNAAFSKMHKANVERICRVFGIPASYVVSPHSNYHMWLTHSVLALAKTERDDG